MLPRPEQRNPKQENNPNQAGELKQRKFKQQLMEN